MEASPADFTGSEIICTFTEIMNSYQIETNQEKSDLVVSTVYPEGRGQKLSIPKED
jgi:hypothetical protein